MKSNAAALIAGILILDLCACGRAGVSARTDARRQAPSPAVLARDIARRDPAAWALAGRTAGAALPVLQSAVAHPSLYGLIAVDPELARRINALMPPAALPNPPAQSFVLRGSSIDRARAEHCLTQAIYFEAGDQSDQGQAAVAQTVLNRLRHPDFPKSVCGVVYEGSQLPTGCQFSFTCDGSLARGVDAAGWARARTIARRALDGHVEPAVGWATHYHADYVAPYWAPIMVKLTQIGAHIFYRWPGLAGMPQAFTGRYGGHEADPVAATLIAANPAAPVPEAVQPPRERTVVLALGGDVHAYTAPTAPGAVVGPMAGRLVVRPHPTPEQVDQINALMGVSAPGAPKPSKPDAGP